MQVERLRRRARQVTVPLHLDAPSQLRAFLDGMALAGHESAAASSTQQDGVAVITTIHQAKGLEWDTVCACALAR